MTFDIFEVCYVMTCLLLIPSSNRPSLFKWIDRWARSS